VESIIPGQPCPVPSPTLAVFVLWFLYFSLKNLGKAGLDMKDLIEKVTQMVFWANNGKDPKALTIWPVTQNSVGSKKR
jgi:hypothetical protein